MFRTLVCSALAPIALASPCFAQPTDLDAGLEAVRAAISDPGFSGAVTILVDGETVLSEARGLADKSTERTNTLETRFNIASIGKLFTALAYSRLAEAGPGEREDFRNRLVRDLLPRHADLFSADLTAGDLLAHRTSIEGFLEGEGAPQRLVAAENNTDVFGLVRDAQIGIIGRRLNGLAYNNSNAIVVGEIVATLADSSYEDAVRQWVIEPAGAQSAVFASFAESETLNLALPYVEAGFSRDAPGPHGPQPDRDLASEYPQRVESPLLDSVSTAAGGLFVTVPDLAEMGWFALNGDADTGDKLARMCESILPIPGRIFGYGCGGEEIAPGVTRWGHGGGAPGINAQLAIYPELGIVLAVAANHNERATPVMEAFEAALAGVNGPQSVDGFVIRGE